MCTRQLWQPQGLKKTDPRALWLYRFPPFEGLLWHCSGWPVSFGSNCSVGAGSRWIFELRWQLLSVDREGKALRNPEGVITTELGAVFCHRWCQSNSETRFFCQRLSSCMWETLEYQSWGVLMVCDEEVGVKFLSTCNSEKHESDFLTWSIFI